MIEPELSEWMEKYGTVTTISFMVFGPNLTEEHCELLSKGISLHLLAVEEDPLHFVFVKEIGEEEASALNTFQGTNLSIVLPEDKTDISEYIKETCEFFFKFIRLKCDFINAKAVENNV